MEVLPDNERVEPGFACRASTISRRVFGQNEVTSAGMRDSLLPGNSRGVVEQV
jgi:hypothetical protein